MSAFYLESSSLVKRYAKEKGTSWIVNLLRPSAHNWIYVSSLTLVEVTAALARRRKGKTLTIRSADKSIFRFRRDFEKRFLIIEITPVLLNEAADLSDKYSLRGFDALQLAAVLEADQNRQTLGLSSLVFVSADNELNTAANAEGLKVENPNNYP